MDALCHQNDVEYDESVLLSPEKLHEIIKASVCEEYEKRITELEDALSTKQAACADGINKQTATRQSEIATLFDELISNIEDSNEVSCPRKKRRHECLINSCKINTENMLYHENVDTAKALRAFKNVVLHKEKEGANVEKGMKKWITARIKAEIV
jgi:uncharacterized coiled-coil protein SlyX